MAAEIGETPAVIARLLEREGATLRTLGAKLRAIDPAVIVTCARGSSDHAAGYFKYLTEIFAGVPVASLGPSVASIYRAKLRLRHTVVIAVSQSGASPDLVALQAAARDGGAFAIAAVNQLDSPLAAGADAVIPLHAGPERSVAATKSCIAAAVALAGLLAEWRGDVALGHAVSGLPAALDRALAGRWEEALAALRSARSAYTIGRGPALPIAAEAALKLKETCVLHAEAFSGAEVMHGPLELVERGFPVIAFCQQDASAAATQHSLARVRGFGGAVFEASSAPTGHAALDPLAMLLSFYAFAEQLARDRGHDPDHPSHLRKVTLTV